MMRTGAGPIGGWVSCSLLAVLGTACMTPGQSYSVRTQVGEIREQVESLHDQQDRNGRAIRDAAASRTVPDPAPARRAAQDDAPEVPIQEPPAAPPPGAEPAASRPGALYLRGYALYHQGEYARSQEALGAFLLAEPGSPHADNAQYWIGECYYARGLYSEAIDAFRAVVDRHPGSDKASHALYRIALAFENLGEDGGMHRALRDLIDRFPESDVAALARSRLGGA